MKCATGPTGYWTEWAHYTTPFSRENRNLLPAGACENHVFTSSSNNGIFYVTFSSGKQRGVIHAAFNIAGQE